MLKRIIVTIVAIPIILFIISLNNLLPFKILMYLTLLMSLVEFFLIMKNKGFPARWIVDIAGANILIFSSFSNNNVPQVCWLATIFIADLVIETIYIIKNRDNAIKENNGFLSVLVRFAGIFYVCWLGSHIIALRAIPLKGKDLMFLLLAVVWFGDGGAYFIGTFFGKRKIGSLSPSKTYEGLIGGVVFSVIGGLFIYFLLLNITIPLIKLTALLVALGIIGQFGDLAESLMKRFAGVKDSLVLIPGHGGVLDKIDSMLFTAPLLYYFIRFIM